MTVRDRIHAFQSELRSGDVVPSRAREILMELSALLGNVLTEEREAEAAYNVVLLALLEGDEAANRARIRAAITPEYARLKVAKDTHTTVVEQIRSLKVILRSIEEEMRLSA